MTASHFAAATSHNNSRAFANAMNSESLVRLSQTQSRGHKRKHGMGFQVLLIPYKPVAVTFAAFLEKV